MRPADVAFEQVVFAITVAGYTELRNANTLLSLQERTVLTLIDGVCPVAQYLPFLSEFEPLVIKFKKLEQLGLLRAAGQVSSSAVRLFDEQVNNSAPVSKWQSISSECDQSGFVALR